MNKLVRKNGAYVKSQRMKEIAKYVSKTGAKGPITLSKLVAWVQVNIGLTESKALDYIKTCAEAYDWIFKPGQNLLEVPE